MCFTQVLSAKGLCSATSSAHLLIGDLAFSLTPAALYMGSMGREPNK